MAYIKEYWSEKSVLARKAQENTEIMARYADDKIEECVKNTVLYDANFTSRKYYTRDTTILIEDLDSVAAIMAYGKECKERRERIAVLNFSSYKNPGGMFLNGSKAQEECLCHESFLYNVLSRFSEFYEWNNKHKNEALYLNRALYSPYVLFARKFKWVLCDVITCAAPNKSTAQKYHNVSDEENSEVLKSRIKFVLDIAKENEVDTLILGAYGCGVFGQDAKEVAGIFKEYLTTTHQCFEKVVFAIPKGRDGNLESFKSIFGC